MGRWTLDIDIVNKAAAVQAERDKRNDDIRSPGIIPKELKWQAGKWARWLDIR